VSTLRPLALYVDGVEISTNRIRLSVEVEQIDVRTMTEATEADPAWSFTDAAGHFHAWSKDSTLPTLRSWRDESSYCEMCRDEHEGELQWACMICLTVVKPGTRVRAVQPPDTVPGRKSWRIEGLPFDQPIAQDVQGVQVSVRVVAHAALSAGGDEYFGVAARYADVLHGVGELARRLQDQPIKPQLSTVTADVHDDVTGG
jgi:hypothetical protein